MYATVVVVAADWAPCGLAYRVSLAAEPLHLSSRVTTTLLS